MQEADWFQIHFGSCAEGKNFCFAGSRILTSRLCSPTISQYAELFTVNPTYCPLLKRMQLTNIAQVEYLKARDHSSGKTYVDPARNVSLCHCVTFYPLVAICWCFFLYNKPKFKYMCSFNHTEHYSHAQNTTALQLNLFFNLGVRGGAVG